MATPPLEPPFSYYFLLTEDSVLRIPTLPEHLLIRSLSFLPQRELRRMSQASSAWYRLVYKAGLEMHRTITDVDSSGLDTVAQIAEHVQTCESPLRLSLELRCRPSWYFDPETAERALDRMSAIVARTLPFLARLSVHSTCHVAERLCAALSSSAPYLHSLTLDLDPNDYIVPLALPPTFLCGGKAPCLRTVTIDAPLLDPTITAPDGMFAGVRAVNLTLHDEQQELAVSETFPDARELKMHVKCTEIRVETLPQLSVSLAGLTLRSLTFNNSDGRSVSLSMDGMSWSDIAEVSYTSPSLDGGLPDGFWPTAREFIAFVARAEAPGSSDPRSRDILTITLSTPDVTWRCTLRTDFDVAERTALPELAGLPTARLTSLVVSVSLLGYLLHTEAALPALQSVHAVDCLLRQGEISVRGRAVGPRELPRSGKTSVLCSVSRDDACSFGGEGLESREEPQSGRTPGQSTNAYTYCAEFH